jgi:anhydro-N-acetylmuramic acid kinase
MSGTSLDGVDVAMLDTDGQTIAGFGPTGYRPYTDTERTLLFQALEAARGLTDRTARPGLLAEAEALVTSAHAEALVEFLEANGIDRASVAVVGFHGQTVLHKPDAGLTVQIGNGRELARQVGLPIVYDFRAADVAGGGQGAPLVPIYHQALAHGLDRSRPIALLNVGGVANLTFIGSGDPVACDTGPGNALIDDFMRARTGAPLDRDGRQAACGQVDESFVGRALEHPFFSAPYPKSLDRNAFAFAHADLQNFSLSDGAATLSALTAASIAHVVPLLPEPPRAWIVCGGGAHNPTLMRMLAERLAPASVETAGAAGWIADAIEAQAFAYLAVRRLRNLPITFPTTTGVPRPLVGGVVAAPEGCVGRPVGALVTSQTAKRACS